MNVFFSVFLTALFLCLQMKVLLNDFGGLKLPCPGPPPFSCMIKQSQISEVRTGSQGRFKGFWIGPKSGFIPICMYIYIYTYISLILLGHFQVGTWISKVPKMIAHIPFFLGDEPLFGVLWRSRWNLSGCSGHSCRFTQTSYGFA